MIAVKGSGIVGCSGLFCAEHCLFEKSDAGSASEGSTSENIHKSDTITVHPPGTDAIQVVYGTEATQDAKRPVVMDISPPLLMIRDVKLI